MQLSSENLAILNFWLLGRVSANREIARILNISTAHTLFLRRIKGQRKGSPEEVLSNPEKYLGPNWRKVLEFWLHLDTLSKDQLNKVYSRYFDLSGEEMRIANNKAWNASRANTIYCGIAGRAAFYSVSTAEYVADYATDELIGNVENPVFVPLFYDF
jgi:hypothetical protein